MPYEVQHNTICDGWINTWSYPEDDGVWHLETFVTAAEAELALAEYLQDLQEELWEDQIEPYDPDDFRVRYMPDTKTELNNQPTGESP